MMLKEAINKCPRLFFIEDGKGEVVVFTDACDYGIGGAVYQLVDGKMVPIALMSKLLSKQEQRWATIEKECYAIVYAFKKFEYLTENTRGSLFKLYADDGSEKYMSFQLRYYEADAGGDNYTGSDNVPSGAYIFKPAKDKQLSMPYTSLVKQESFTLNFVQ
jgi:hypothetical protein